MLFLDTLLLIYPCNPLQNRGIHGKHDDLPGRKPYTTDGYPYPIGYPILGYKQGIRSTMTLMLKMD